jgi:predicted Fe-Mo cluster-binding NifX family protein
MGTGVEPGGATPVFLLFVETGELLKKIAFTTSGQDLAAAMDSRFGRAANFLIYDLEQDSIQLVENRQGRDAAQGAGVQAAETVVQTGVDTLVTGHCGPKAFKVLDASGVAVYNCNAATVKEALDGLLAGSLKPASASDDEGQC